MIKNYDGSTEFEGAVLAKGELSCHDDSDFYAVVWDGTRVRRVTYDTTRCGGGGSCTIDATPEVKALARAWMRSHLEPQIRAQFAWHAHQPYLGREVEVVAGKKVPIGTRGIVFWSGRDRFGGMRVGIKTTTGEKFFTSRSNVVADEPVDEDEILEAVEEQVEQWRLVGANPSIPLI